MGVARVRLQRMQSHDKAFAAARAKVNHTITHLSRCSGSALLTPHEAVGGEIIVRRRVCTKSIKYITTPSRWQVPAEQARLQDMHAHVMRPEAGMPREHRVCLQYFLCTVPMLMGVLESYWYLRPVNWPSLQCRTANWSKESHTSHKSSYLSAPMYYYTALTIEQGGRG